MKTEIAKEAGGTKSAEIKNSLKEDTRTNKKVSVDPESKKSLRNPKIKDIGKENATNSRSLSEDKSGDEQSESSKKGRLKNLAGFWSTPQDDAKVYRKKRLQIDETSPAESVSNEPAPLLLSRRVEESNPERPKPEIDHGYAKNMASIFQNRPKSATETKKQFRLDIDEEINEDNSKAGESKAVGEAGDQIQPSSVKLKRRIKDLAGTFQSKSKDDDSAVQQSSADQKPLDPILESCRTKGLAERWNQQKMAQKSEEDDSGDEASVGEEAKKSKQAWWLLELEEARQQDSQGVFENEPEVRDDVIRADDEMPDVISARSTRKTRQLWSTIEQEKKKEKEEEEKKAEEKKAEKAATKARKISDTNTPDSSKSVKVGEEGKGKSSKCNEEPQDTNNKSASRDDGKDSKCENVGSKSGERSFDNKTDDSPLVKTRKSKSADNEEDEWFDASGFLLNNASLLHVPRGKPLRGYVE